VPPRAERGGRGAVSGGEGAVSAACCLSLSNRSSCAAPSAFPARTIASHTLLDAHVSGAGRGASCWAGLESRCPRQLLGSRAWG
jgi:hypothetical protein